MTLGAENMNQLVAPIARVRVPDTVSYALGEQAARPWGTWEVLATGVGYALKRIVVNPGQRLSLQYHKHRSEHWTIVQGSAEAEIDGKRYLLEAGEHIYVPLGAHHRIRNAGDTPVVFVEVQVGAYLDEGDIIRLQDDYARL